MKHLSWIVVALCLCFAGCNQDPAPVVDPVAASVARIQAKTPAQIDQELADLDKAVTLEEGPQGEVLFNQATHKVHVMGCPAGRRCTKNCVRMTRAKAVSLGGIPCGRCGGGL